jgi:hypothetical protein
MDMTHEQTSFRSVLKKLYRKAPAVVLVSRAHWRKFGAPLPFFRPKTLSEKINWIKIFGDIELLAACADKVAVRDHVRRRLGDRVRLPELFLVTEDADDIDPSVIGHERFVVKASHDSGSALICRDRNSFDFEAAKKTLSAALKTDYSQLYFEPHYQKITPRLLVEEYLQTADGSAMGDWRIMCMNGRAAFLYVNMHESGEKTRAYFDRDWNRIPVRQSAPDHPGAVPRPPFLDELFEMAEILAADFDFVRVDFNIVDGAIYFGELTFTPQGGFIPYDPPAVDRLFGESLRLTRSRYAPVRALLRAGLVGGA